MFREYHYSNRGHTKYMAFGIYQRAFEGLKYMIVISWVMVLFHMGALRFDYQLSSSAVDFFLVTSVSRIFFS